jgi:hypothetical protein
MSAATPIAERRPTGQVLTALEEIAVVLYIPDLKAREFPPSLKCMRDMTDRVLDCDLYNFDETSFTIGIICSSIVVTRSDQRGKGKTVQHANREWATAVACINGDGLDVSPYPLVQGTCHLADLYSGGGLPDSWIIKLTSNGGQITRQV